MPNTYGFNALTDPAKQQEYMRRLGVPNYWDQIADASPIKTGSLGGRSSRFSGVDPAMIQEQRQQAANERNNNQYQRLMQMLQLKGAERNENQQSALEQMMNQRFAGANPGATSPGGVAGPWGDSAAQGWFNQYLTSNLGLNNSNRVLGMPSGQKGSSNAFNRAEYAARKGR